MTALILRGGDISSGFLNVSTERYWRICETKRYVQSGVLLYLENTFRIRYVASIANDTVIQRTFVGASQPALVAGEVGHDSNDCGKKKNVA
ncbi:hypothetical protein TNCV_3159971 [Trichonephila clavipes]|nr:hypothetical protein TNCV_3159971 [Trichonephila clavipes]